MALPRVLGQFFAARLPGVTHRDVRLGSSVRFLATDSREETR